eukprot:756381-Hanusia_phi.AAC.1
MHFKFVTVSFRGTQDPIMGESRHRRDCGRRRPVRKFELGPPSGPGDGSLTPRAAGPGPRPSEAGAAAQYGSTRDRGPGRRRPGAGGPTDRAGRPAGGVPGTVLRGPGHPAYARGNPPPVTAITRSAQWHRAPRGRAGPGIPAATGGTGSQALCSLIY